MIQPNSLRNDKSVSAHSSIRRIPILLLLIFLIGRLAHIHKFPRWGVCISTEGIDKIHSDVWSREIISTLKLTSNHLINHNIKVIIVLLFTVMF